ncbi:hypothetical protein [Tessaracoccus palaemonis]|uniref:Uncharacterized protein n=1 Tax=Tessaracoccus palaemonis TaxID=2829499 RepID=A0ABX8SNE8_9ACTN|nr:hypothetical protein [Tessaracoccus palaemonis]QXT62729.1 hypothetical protein KDB89_13500 [Tessaracoccus palaemonis]
MSGSCWHDGPDHCPGCRHCADSWGDPDEPPVRHYRSIADFSWTPVHVPEPDF